MLKCKFFGHVLSIGVQSACSCSPLSIFRIIRHDRRANVGQIETAIIRHWLPRRGSGVFLNPPPPPRRNGGGKLDVKRTRRGWFAPRIHALHHYTARNRSGDRSVTAFFSRDRSFPRDILPWRFKGHDTGDRSSSGLEITHTIDNFSCTRDVPLNYHRKRNKKKWTKHRLPEENRDAMR